MKGKGKKVKLMYYLFCANISKKGLMLLTNTNGNCYIRQLTVLNENSMQKRKETSCWHPVQCSSISQLHFDCVTACGIFLMLVKLHIKVKYGCRHELHWTRATCFVPFLHSFLRLFPLKISSPTRACAIHFVPSNC